MHRLALVHTADVRRWMMDDNDGECKGGSEVQSVSTHY